MHRQTIERKFSPSLRQKVSDGVRPSLQSFEEISARLATISKGEAIWNPPEDLRELLDRYLEILSIIYLKKYSAFSESIIQALNQENYLLYGLIGRSIIEHAAVLRYYVTNKLAPLARDIFADKIVTDAEAEEFIQWLDKHLAGSRFDWNDYLSDSLQKIKGLKPEMMSQPAQINVITCLKKWGQENEKIIHLYELFCDLVHPNLGSTLLITQIFEERFVVGSQQGESIGLEIVNRTFGELVDLFKEVRGQLIQLQSFKCSYNLTANTPSTESVNLNEWNSYGI